MKAHRSHRGGPTDEGGGGPRQIQGEPDRPRSGPRNGPGSGPRGPDATIDQVPMADGGEGTVEALVAATGGPFREARHRPAGRAGRRPLRAAGRRPDRRDRDGGGLGPGPGPRRRATPVDRRPRGARANCSWPRSPRERGGSSSASAAARPTTAAPGWARRSAFACSMPRAATSSRAAARSAASTRIDESGRRRELDGVEIAVACDVDNPLCGPAGARPSTARRRGRRRR